MGVMILVSQNLSDFFILKIIKNIDYRVYISGADKKAAVFILKNSDLYDKGILAIDFTPNVSPVEVIKKGAFGGTYFRDICSGVNDRWYKNSWKEFEELESIDKTYYASDFYNVSLNKYGVECGTSLRFWKKKDGLIK